MATTALISEQKSILWRIPNFEEVRKSERKLNGQHFKFEMNVGTGISDGPATPILWKCFMRAKPKNRGSGTKDYVGLYICPKNFPPELTESYARIRFQVEDTGKGRYYFDRQLCGVRQIQKILDEGIGRGFRDLVPRFSQETPFLTADGALEILITVTVFYPQPQNAELALLEAQFKDVFVRKLQSQLTDVRRSILNVTSKDTKMVSKDGVHSPVNRVILAARSSVFRAMFQSNMSEEQNGVVEVKDLDSKALEVLLHFLHTGELTKNWRKEGIIEGLLYGAHKYELQDLLDFLDEVAGLVCSDANCGKLMGLAKTFELKVAQQRLMDYFQKNMAADVDKVLKFAEDTANAATLMMMTQPEAEEEEQNRKKRKTAG